MLDAILTGAGAGASATAIIGGWVSLRRAIRGRRQRRELASAVHRLLRLDYWLNVGCRHLDIRLAEGVGWAGHDVWPAKLTGGLNYMAGISDELSVTGARLRSMDEASGAIGRLREDIEELCRVLAAAADRYRLGSLAAYRKFGGAPIPWSAAGREVTPALQEDDIQTHIDGRARATWLFRSCLFRVRPELAHRYDCQWPVRRHEFERLQPPVVPGIVPLPVDWSSDLPSLD